MISKDSPSLYVDVTEKKASKNIFTDDEVCI